jgi:hypothetical protein
VTKNIGELENTAAGESSVPVVRNGSCMFVAADHGLALHLGRDVQLTFLQYHQSVKRQKVVEEGDGSFDGFDIQPEFLEVAVVRMPPISVIAMALGALDAIASTGAMKTTALETAFDEILKKSRESQSSSEDDDK